MTPAYEADRIGDQLRLLQWIESARTELQQLHDCRGVDKDLAARLTAHGLRSGLDWMEDQSAALHELMAELSERVAALAKAGICKPDPPAGM